MSELNPQLIADLARLATRYAPEEWERLISCLEDEQRRAQISRLLHELAATSRTRRQGSRPVQRSSARAPKLREALAQTRDRDPARAELLEGVWLKLRQRELLPTMAMVRAFAEAVGLKGLEATRREQAVTELLEHLVQVPSDVLEQMLRQTIVEDRDLGEEYERWVRLILGRRSVGG